MPRTRRAARALAAERERKLISLPADVLSLVLCRLPLAHDIARAGSSCRTLKDAARLAFLVRPFSAREFPTDLNLLSMPAAMDVLPDGRAVFGMRSGEVKTFAFPAASDPVCLQTMRAHDATGLNVWLHDDVSGVAVLPGGERFVSCSEDGTAKLWKLADGTLERTFIAENGLMMRMNVFAVVALPDGEHFAISVNGSGTRVYHVNGTLVHIFFDAMSSELAVTPDGHLIGLVDQHPDFDHPAIHVWSVAQKRILTVIQHPGFDDDDVADEEDLTPTAMA